MKPILNFFILLIVVTIIGFPVGPVAAQSTTPGTDEPTPMATAVPTGVVTGKITNMNNPEAPVGELEVMLHILDQDQNELGMLHGQSAADGSFTIKDVPMTAGIGYAAAVVFNETTYYSSITWAESEATSIDLNVPVFETTPDLTDVRIEQMHVLFKFAQDGIEVKELFALSNLGNRTVKGGQVIPGNNEVKASVLFPLPENADFISFEPQDNSRFIKFAGGFADLAPIQPGEMANVFVVNYLIPYGDPRTFTYQINLPVKKVNFLLVHTSGIQLEAEGLGAVEQVNGQDGSLYDLYPMENLPAGTELVINLEGEINFSTDASIVTAEASVTKAQLPLTIGLAIPGLVLAGGGVAWWVKSNKRTEEEEAEEVEENNHLEGVSEQGLDELLEAINQLDLKFESGEIDESQYHLQRDELTARAKALLPEG